MTIQPSPSSTPGGQPGAAAAGDGAPANADAHAGPGAAVQPGTERGADGAGHPQDDHADKGNTRTQQSHGSVARLPNERDESVDSQPPNAPVDNVVSQAAYRDAVGRQTDTDRGPMVDKLYNDQVRPDDNAAR